MTDHCKALCTARGYSDISTSDDGKLKTILIQIPQITLKKVLYVDWPINDRKHDSHRSCFIAAYKPWHSKAFVCQIKLHKHLTHLHRLFVT